MIALDYKPSKEMVDRVSDEDNNHNQESSSPRNSDSQNSKDEDRNTAEPDKKQSGLEEGKEPRNHRLDDEGQENDAMSQTDDQQHDRSRDQEERRDEQTGTAKESADGEDSNDTAANSGKRVRSSSRRDKERSNQKSDDRSGEHSRERSRRHRSDRESEKGRSARHDRATAERSPGKESDSRSHTSRRSHRRRRSHSRDPDEHGDRDRHRDRRDRDRDGHSDRERNRDRDRDRDRERDRDRNRERDRERDHKRSHRSRGSVDEDRSRYRKRHRSPSRDRSRDRGSRADDLDDRELERQRRYDEADGEDRRRRSDRRSPRYRPYDSAHSPPRRSSSPHLTEEEHEMRSVFVSQLSARVGDRELSQFFEKQAGKVRDARVITDRISRRSKGVGYVEFRELESVQKALALTGTKLLGLPVMVQYTEAEKNRQALANTQPSGPPAGFVPVVPPPTTPKPYVAPKARGPGPNDPNSYARLYVGSLNFSLTDDDVRQVFQPFGAIEYVDLHRDQVTGKSKGYAFVQYKNMHDAKNATEKMNGFQLAGRPLRVEIKAQPPPALLNATAPGVASPVVVAPTGGNFTAAPANAYEERLEDPVGGNLNQISRVELMHKLARTEQPTSVPVTDMFRPNIPTATSRSVLLKNMFNPEEETEPGWDSELRDDVKSECEEKYGPVLSIAIEKDSTAGDIYVTFNSIESAQKAIAGLNNRWFGGRQITAGFISDALVAAHGGK